MIGLSGSAGVAMAMLVMTGFGHRALAAQQDHSQDPQLENLKLEKRDGHTCKWRLVKGQTRSVQEPTLVKAGERCGLGTADCIKLCTAPGDHRHLAECTEGEGGCFQHRDVPLDARVSKSAQENWLNIAGGEVGATIGFGTLGAGPKWELELKVKYERQWGGLTGMVVEVSKKIPPLHGDACSKRRVPVSYSLNADGTVYLITTEQEYYYETDIFNREKRLCGHGEAVRTADAFWEPVGYDVNTSVVPSISIESEDEKYFDEGSCECKPGAEYPVSGQKDQPTGREVPVPDPDPRTRPVPREEIEPLLAHADTFGIARTRVATRPETRTLKIHVTPPPRSSEDEFGNAATVVAVVKDDPTGEPTVKTEKSPDGGTDLTIDVKDLADLAGIFITSAGSVQYVDLNDGADLSNDAPTSTGINRLRDADDAGGPNLMTNPAGVTPPVVLEGIWPEGATVAIGQGPKPTAVFRPAITILEFDEGGNLIAQNTSGVLEGSTEDADVIGLLNEDGTAFREGTVRDLHEVAEGGVTSGPLTPKLTATPQTANVGDTIEVESILTAAAVRSYAEANGIPAEAAMENLEVVISHDGREVASGVGRATYETKARTANEFLKFTSTIRWKDRSAMASALDRRQSETLAATEGARGALPPELSAAVLANLRTRVEQAKQRFGPK